MASINIYIYIIYTILRLSTVATYLQDSGFPPPTRHSRPLFVSPLFDVRCRRDSAWLAAPVMCGHQNPDSFLLFRSCSACGNTLAAGQDVQHEMARQVMILPKDVRRGWFFLFFAWYFFVCRSCHFSGRIWKDSGWHERTRE